MKKQLLGYSVVASVMTILFFVIVNIMTSPGHLWFIYPSYVMLWWPISIYFAGKKSAKGIAVVGSLLTISFLIITNYMTSPEYPWFLYAVFPILWWPLVLLLGKKAATVKFAVMSSLSIIIYYTALNILLSPGYAWAIYPAFAVLWWPLTLYFINKKNPMAYAISGTVLTIVFFVIVNVISTSHVIWAVYPIFAVLWWPMSIYYFVYRRRMPT